MLSKSDKKKVSTDIYFLKVEELKIALQSLGLDQRGNKKDLIDRIFEFYDLKREANTKSYEMIHKVRSGVERSDPEKYIVQGIYRNNRHYRLIFKELIGEHFKFTAYGMDWIKNCWKQNYNPKFQEFSTYWQSEFERRKNGGNFDSALTNRRVVFFREHKGMARKDLEKLWAKERGMRSKAVLGILNQNKK